MKPLALAVTSLFLALLAVELIMFVPWDVAEERIASPHPEAFDASAEVSERRLWRLVLGLPFAVYWVLVFASILGVVSRRSCFLHSAWILSYSAILSAWFAAMQLGVGDYLAGGTSGLASVAMFLGAWFCLMRYRDSADEVGHL